MGDLSGSNAPALILGNSPAPALGGSVPGSSSTAAFGAGIKPEAVSLAGAASMLGADVGPSRSTGTASVPITGSGLGSVPNVLPPGRRRRKQKVRKKKVGLSIMCESIEATPLSPPKNFEDSWWRKKYQKAPPGHLGAHKAGAPSPASPSPSKPFNGVSVCSIASQ